ncbi:MAG: adenylate/guanylate cyclase domain-containing protein [Devosia sp.]
MNPETGPQAGQTATSREAAGGKGERRVITVLFADVVNSTGLAERLDPEDWTDIMNAAFPAMTAPITRYGGTVARLMGDGLLAFFGAPVAHEDDPQRAVLAALEMLDAVRGFASKVKRDLDIDFEIRIGLNTGPVVVTDVGSIGAMEYTAMGDAVNVAARMQQTAAPGTVQLSSETDRLVAGHIDTAPLGKIELKGKAEPVDTFRVVGRKPEPERSRGLGQVGAGLVGRDAQIAELKHAVDELRQGRGQVVCLIGEAGLGKSRLIDELKAYWRETGGSAAWWEEMRGVPYDTGRPFGLFQSYARRMFGVELDDTPEAIDRKVHATLDPLNRAPPQSVGLCSIAMQRIIAAKSLDDRFGFSTQAVRQDIFDLMAPAFRENCKSGPTVLIVDDLQWADTASADLLMQLMVIIEDAPLLVVCAFRPERQSPAWQAKLRAETDFPHRYREIVLSPLGASDTEALLSSLLSIADLPTEVHQLILRKADGNPYFVEEIVRSLTEQGVVSVVDGERRWKAGALVTDLAIPDSLQALLMARIDRLGEEAKSTLQMASVIGRAFYYRILEAISNSAMALDKDLLALERVELLREAGRQPELEYIFKHELARDAAYATILNRKRREFHLRVARAMESLFADHLEEHAHRLAQHFEAAREDQPMMDYYIMAGDAAASIGADTEAAAHYAKALEAARRAGASDDLIAKIEVKRLPLAVTHEATPLAAGRDL